VIGGGNAAIAAAREAIRGGAASVDLCYRRTSAEMPAYRSAVEAAGTEGVRFHWLTSPIRFVGEDRLTGVECQRMRLEPCDGSARECPAPVGGSEFEMPADVAVRATGRRSPLEFLRWVEGLEQGRPRVDPLTAQTTNPKYFAGGAVVDGGAPVGVAVQAGKRGARGIDAWLRLQDRSSA
jgi:NADPH-dependent glutamate synthase beta subunit-like oxidoreductase